MPVATVSGGDCLTKRRGGGPQGLPAASSRRHRLAHASGPDGPACQDDVGLQADQLLRERSYPIGVTAGPTKVHPHVTVVDPTEARKRLSERDAKLPLRIVFANPMSTPSPRKAGWH
jgi:hypothetical protein